MSAPTQARAEAGRTTERRCRSCGTPLTHVVVDLGTSPLANAYLSEAQLAEPEPFYPLRVYVCEGCFLVQLPPVVSPAQMFGNYAYFSSYSDSWLEHARAYAGQMIERFGLDSTSRVVEIASNDGYLLRYFKEAGMPVLGVEPAANIAAAAQQAGIPTRVEFFGRETAERLSAEGEAAELVVGNNVLAHVPDLTGFVAGVEVLLAPRGVATFEFPHLLRLIESGAFDTIYHEHLFYFSLLAVDRVFADAGMTLFDVEELPTHGGSLRIYARHADDDSKPVEAAVKELRDRERDAGLDGLDAYEAFEERTREAKRRLLEFLVAAKHDGKSIVGYGAAAKGNTLLNYCGVRGDFLDYVVDRSPHKQGLFLPGTHLPILDPAAVGETRPDYLLILPWNLRDEITAQMSDVRAFGCKFVVPIPETTVYD